MTVVVRFQLIFLMKIKYISFRDLSPIRPFQELFQTRAGFIFLSDSPSTRLGLGHTTFVCIFLSLLRKIWIISLLSFAPQEDLSHFTSVWSLLRKMALAVPSPLDGQSPSGSYVSRSRQQNRQNKSVVTDNQHEDYFGI